MSVAVVDSIVVGGGHNALVCAFYLAKAGQKVLLLEAADRLGGAAVTREFTPGFRVSACAHLLHMLPEEISRDMALARHGLDFAGTQLPTTALSEHGTPVRIGAGDAGPDAAFRARLRKFAKHLRPMLNTVPPRLGTDNWADRSRLLRLAWQVRSLGRNDMRELLRIVGMNAHDLALDNLETPALQGALAFDAVLGGSLGPRAPGTVLNLLVRMAAEHGSGGLCQPRGGMGTVTQAMEGAARSAGALLRTGARVAQILVDHDRAAGVVLESGEIVAARQVVSGIDPRGTFLTLLGSAHLDAGFVRRVVHVRQRGMTGKLHLALNAAPSFRGLDAASLRGRLLIAPSSEYLEQAQDFIKYGEVPEAPGMEITVPSIGDPDLAPAGQHVLSAIVQFMPHTPRAGWDTLRESFIRRLVALLDSYAPGLRDHVVAAELLTPADIEAEFGLPGGNWHHGELAFDQFLMMRPVPGAAQYRSPVDGVFLCGAGCHPGGGVMGIAGRNAAREVLKHAA
jgi:phytoene dehydrogenase-like protein